MVTPNKPAKGKYPDLDVGKLGGHAAADFVLKGSSGKSGFALNGEGNIDVGAAIDVFVRRPGNEAPKKVLLDVWALPYRHSAPPRLKITHRTDVDFKAGGHSGTKVEGTGDKAYVTTVSGSGDGRDGKLVAKGTTTINKVASAVAGGSKGANDVTVASATGFTAGDIVIVAQMAGTGAGTWHRTAVTAVSGSKLSLDDALPITFQSTGGHRAQVVRVQQYASAVVPSGTTLSAPAWNGTTGGILALVSQGTLVVAGTVTMSAAGFRGSSQKGHAYRNQHGTQGQGSGGVNVGKTTNNAGNGGGGGHGNQDSGGGGGGGHGSAGAKGPACGGHGGGNGGAAVGNPEQTAVFMGGAGGEGGADEDGSYPGRGGHGGGIIELRGASVSITGTVSSDGEAGRPGCQNCGGTGSGMGGGGGGAGGSIRLVGGVVDNQGTVRATGGAGAAKCSNCCTGGAGGGVGRITLAADTLKGKATSPAAKQTKPDTSAGTNDGVYAANVVDAGAPGARIARLSYIASAPGKATWKVEVRAADTAFSPTDAKPVWEVSKYSGQPLTSKGRYIQYRVVMQGQGTDRPRFDVAELLIDRPTPLGALPTGVKVAVAGKDVPHKATDAKAAGEHVLSQHDLTTAFNATAGPITRVTLSSTGPGRVQWLLWIDR